MTGSQYLGGFSHNGEESYTLGKAGPAPTGQGCHARGHLYHLYRPPD